MEKENKTKEEAKKKKAKQMKVVMWVAICIVIILGVILIIRALKGNVQTIGEYPGDVKSISVTCENTGDDYPIFRYDNSNGKETKVSAIYAGDKLETMSLVHALYYNNLNESIGSEGHNHAAMGIKMGEDGLNIDEFAATYSKSDTRMQMTLFARKADFVRVGSKAYKYFLLDNGIPESAEEFREFFQKKGFSCSLNS